MKNQQCESNPMCTSEHVNLLLVMVMVGGGPRLNGSFAISPTTILCCPHLNVPLFICLFFEESIQRGKQKTYG